MKKEQPEICVPCDEATESQQTSNGFQGGTGRKHVGGANFWSVGSSHERITVDSRPANLTESLDFVALASFQDDLSVFLRKAHDLDRPFTLHALDINLHEPINRMTLDALACVSRMPNCLSIGEDLGQWTYRGVYQGAFLLPPIKNSVHLERTARAVDQLMKATEGKFAPENPPVYIDIGDMTMAEYMGQLQGLTGCNCVLDVGHLLGYCRQFGVPTDEEFGAIGSLKLADVHVSGLRSRIWEGLTFWIDAHDAPLTDEHLARLTSVLESCPSSKRPVITLEQEGASSEVFLANLDAIRSTIAVLNP